MKQLLIKKLKRPLHSSNEVIISSVVVTQFVTAVASDARVPGFDTSHS